MNTRLMVYVRVRPVNADDQRSIIDIVDDETLVFDPIDAENQPSDEYYYHGKKFKSIGAKRHKNSSYSFDRVFNENATNYQIYENVTKPMVDATINGLNCSVFAYGATGSGKTFTMLGSRACPGVIYYTSRDLFGKLSTISKVDPLPAELKICYFEIYNEKVRDLLVIEQKNYINCGNKRLRTTPERCRARQQLFARDNYNLPVCEAPGDGLVIPDLTYHCPSNAEELIELLAAGNANRSQHPTDANADSSRSHAIFQILLTRRTRRNNGSISGAEYELQTSKMSLIDLAGSERASVAYRAGNDRSKNLQREGGNINKSLLALGNCINALADNKTAQRHVPYRNSKLTRLLRDSLGGKCKTAMIATVCQQQSHYDDTQNTLVYASRAKCIKLKPGRNFTDVAIQPKNYSFVIENQSKQISMLQSQNDDLKIQIEDFKIQNEDLKIENEGLKKELNTLRLQSERLFTLKHEPTPQPQFNLHTTFNKSDRNFLDESQYSLRLEALYEERAEIKLDILKNLSKFKMNQLKIAFKQLDNMEAAKTPHGNATMIIASSITSTLTIPENSQALKTQMDFFEQERQSHLERARMNEADIRDLLSSMTSEFELNGYGSAEEFDSIIEPYIREKERYQELEERKLCNQHCDEVLRTVIHRVISDKSLLNEAADTLRHNHALNRGRGFSDQVEAKLLHSIRRCEGKKSVIWKDDKYSMENYKDILLLSQQFLIHDHLSQDSIISNNNTLYNRRPSTNLTSINNYTPEQTNSTFDASQ